MKEITSVKNSFVAFATELASAKGRRESGCFLLEGEKLIGEAAGAGLRFKAIMSCDASYSGFERYEREESYLLKEHVMRHICDTVSPQGAAAVAYIPKEVELTGGSLFLIMDNVADPGNVGAMIRTADAAGADAVILSQGCADPYSPKAMRAAMGSLFHLPVLSRDLSELIGELKAKGVVVAATALDGSDFYERAEVYEPLALVIGNEARGISEEVKRLCDRVYKLDTGKAESLNAAAAAAVMLFDIKRRRYYKN